MLEIARIAFQDVRKFFNEDGNLVPIHELDDDAAAAIAGMDIDELWAKDENGDSSQVGVTKKIKRFDKTKALEMLAKHFRIYSDAPVTNQTVKIGYGKEEPV